jgi:multidrug efflux system membrane fusion protein
MMPRSIAVVACSYLVLVLGPLGCTTRQQAKEDRRTEVSFIYPQQRDNIQDYVEYTGRTAATGTVDVKARVTGFLLDTQLFKEGDPVTKGQKLFLIDSKPYDAQLKQAEAQVGLYKAQVELTTATYEQATEVAKKDPKTFSALTLRTYKAQMVEAEAGLDAAKATLEIARLNREYTTVTAPISGVVGRRNQTPGNVIMQDQTLLTTIVSLDKMYVYFDMDAPTYARFNPTGTSGKAPLFLESPAGSSASPDAQTSEIKGDINFFNNQFNPATDTILVRGEFDNSVKKPGGSRRRPGMFVRVKATIGQPYKALVVPDTAIISKMGKKYVYTIDADNRVKDVQVTMGQLQDQVMRVIKREIDPATGQPKPGQLTDKDRVITSRLLDIQPKQEVVPVPPSSPAAK